MPWTLPVMFAVANCLVLLNTAGIPNCSKKFPALSQTWNEFGWPERFLQVSKFTDSQWAQLQRSDTGSPAYVPISPRELPWKLDAETSTIDREALRKNALVAFGVIAYLGLVVELWQRRRKTPPQLTIRGIMALTALVAAAAMLTRSGLVHWYYRAWWPWASLTVKVVALVVIVYGLYQMVPIASKKPSDIGAED